MKRKAWLLWLLLSILLGGCGFQPTYPTYEEASEAHETAQTEEEKAVAETDLEYYEDLIEKAEAYFANREACNADTTDKYMWVCVGSSERYDERKPPDTIDELIRTYRLDRHNCGCTDKQQFLNDLMRY